jgi:hypothetical protein
MTSANRADFLQGADSLCIEATDAVTLLKGTWRIGAAGVLPATLRSHGLVLIFYQSLYNNVNIVWKGYSTTAHAATERI